MENHPVNKPKSPDNKPEPRYYESDLAGASATLPELATQAAKDRFTDIYVAQHMKLEMRDHPLGIEMRLTLNPNSSFAMAVREANRNCERENDFYSAFASDQRFYEQSGFDTVHIEPLVVTFIPVLEGSGNKVKYGDLDSHQAILNEHKLDWVDDSVLTAAAVAYRAAKGFPEGRVTGFPEGSILTGGAFDDGYLFNSKKAVVDRDSDLAIATMVRGRFGVVYIDDVQGITWSSMDENTKAAYIRVAGMTSSSQ